MYTGFRGSLYIQGRFLMRANAEFCLHVLAMVGSVITVVLRGTFKVFENVILQESLPCIASYLTFSIISPKHWRTAHPIVELAV
jgi:hypothetical protein